MRYIRIALAAAFFLSASPSGQAAVVDQPTGAEQFEGVYELGSHKLIYLQPWPGGDGQLAYLDEAGQFRELFPLSKTSRAEPSQTRSSAQTISSQSSSQTFTAGPGVSLRSPVQIIIRFISDNSGKVTGLTRRRASESEQTAQRLPSYTREDVTFHGAAGQLQGVLLSPPTAGPHPALVLIGGTGPSDRNSVLPITEFLLAHGVALLGIDKPGVGGSAGNWQTASLNELAADAVAALTFLKDRKDIDPRRIGFFGASQGGWVAPLAAVQSDAAFVISVSGPAISPAEVEQNRLQTDLRARGFSAEEIRQALDLLKLRDAAAQGEQPLNVLQAALDKNKGARWLPYAPLPATATDALLAHWRSLPLDYDPGPAISRLHVPVLALFGSLDRNVIEPKNADRWKADLEHGKTKDYSVHVFPGANHMLLEAHSGAEEEIASLARFTPGYQALLLDWLRHHGFAR